MRLCLLLIFLLHVLEIIVEINGNPDYNRANRNNWNPASGTGTKEGEKTSNWNPVGDKGKPAGFKTREGVELETNEQNKYNHAPNVHIPPGQKLKPSGGTSEGKEPAFQPQGQYINPRVPEKDKEEPKPEEKQGAGDKPPQGKAEGVHGGSIPKEDQGAPEKPPQGPGDGDKEPKPEENKGQGSMEKPPQGSIEPDRSAYFKVDFYVFIVKTTIKIFKYTESKEFFIQLGINKGKRYRWLVADCMATAQSMFELAEVFKTAFSDDNVMIVVWDHVVTKDPVYGAGYAEFRRALEHVSNVIVWAIYQIHIALYDSGSPSILDNLHIIGFGHAGLIAGNAAWLLSHPQEQIKDSGSGTSFAGIRKVLVDRLTVINTANFCNHIAEDDVRECQETERAYPDYKKDLANINCAKFVDGLYTHRLGLSSTICPRFNGTYGLPHHRGVHINEEVGPVNCDQKLEVKTSKICSELLTHCNHQVGLQYYISAMRLLYGPKTGCHDVIEMMFGDKDPNVPGESVSTNFHFQTKDDNPFGSELGCEENPGAEFPDLKSLSDENCERNELEIVKMTAWKWNKY